MTGPTVVPVPEDRFDDLKPLWRALYDHHSALTPHLRDREVPFGRAWETRRNLERDGCNPSRIHRVQPAGEPTIPNESWT